MALYFNLPVYKVSYKLVFLLFQTSSSFSREYKYTIGQDLKNEGMDLIKNIYRANKAEDKSVCIIKAKENLETVRLLVRLMQDFNQLGIKPFVEINQGIETYFCFIISFQFQQCQPLIENLVRFLIVVENGSCRFCTSIFG